MIKCNLSDKIIKLKGMQLFVLERIIKFCLEHNSTITPEFKFDDLFSGCNIKRNTLKIILYRFKKKGLITNLLGKKGHHNYLKIEINHKVIEKFLFYRDIKRQQKKEQGLDMKNNDHYNAVDFDFKNKKIKDFNNLDTVSKQQEKLIDFSSIAHLGFGIFHVRTLLAQHSVEDINNSIKHFAYSLKFNPRVKKTYDDPLFVFLSVMKKGVLWNDKVLEEKEKIAIDAQKSLLQTKQKIENERLLKQKSIDDKIIFDEWYNSLSEKQLNDIIEKTHYVEPSYRFKVDTLIKIKKGFLQTYYKENVLQNIQNGI